MDKITHKVRCEQWTAIINECLASGMPKTTWCRANGISDKQFFYWQMNNPGSVSLLSGLRKPQIRF